MMEIVNKYKQHILNRPSSESATSAEFRWEGEEVGCGRADSHHNLFR